MNCVTHQRDEKNKRSTSEIMGGFLQVYDFLASRARPVYDVREGGLDKAPLTIRLTLINFDAPFFTALEFLCPSTSN